MMNFDGLQILVYGWASLGIILLSIWIFSALIAGSGFLVNLLSGHYLPIGSYGLFVTLYIIASSSLIFQSSLIPNPLVLIYESISLPRIVNLGNQDAPTTRRYVLSTALWGGLFFILLVSILFTFPLQTVQLIYAKSFGDISLLVRIFSVLPLLWFAGKVFSLALLAIPQKKALFPVYLTACFTLTLGLYMTRQYGASGAGIGFLINGILLTTGFPYQFLNPVKAHPENIPLNSRDLVGAEK